MDLRIGYVNVYGLKRANRRALTGLLGRTFDMLFVAETWYMDYASYSTDRLTLAASQPPELGERKGRQSGGFCVLATLPARAAVEQVEHVSEWRIVVRIRGMVVCGLYLPPRMTASGVGRELDACTSYDVVMGDVNTRFDNIGERQDRHAPGVARRRQDEFTRFRARGGMLHVMPSELPIAGGLRHHDRLTTEHCFIRKGFGTASAQARSPDGVEAWRQDGRASALLTLPDLKQLGIESDHAYALCLRVREAATARPEERFTAPRYRVALLADDRVRSRLARVFCELLAAQPAKRAAKVESVDKLHARLTWLVQEASRRALGEIRVRGPADCEGVAPAERQRGGGGGGGDGPPLAARRMKKLDGMTPEERLADCRAPAVFRSVKEAMRSSGENAPVVPTREAAARGESALAENERLLRERWTAREKDPGEPRLATGASAQRTAMDGAPGAPRLTIDDVRAAIAALDGSKSCGIDGIHSTIMQALLETPATRLLFELYTLCLRNGTTPAAWGDAMVHLITKDERLPRDANNLRPLSLVVLFRKVFEGLLLREVASAAWATVHPAQAGFRHDYSTMTNAAAVHYLLLSRRRAAAVFVDFRTAFDLVDHGRLEALLRQRGCPPRLVAVMMELTARNVRSRTLVNGEPSGWMARTRGVLQGAPLSPLLFNIYVDDLLVRLNRGYQDLPYALMYADDCVLLPPTSALAQSMLDEVCAWSRDAGMALNVAKCGYLGAKRAAPLQVGDERIPIVDQYTYLGFPITQAGIDFAGHVSGRLAKAHERAKWLDNEATCWTPAQRLQVYRLYLAPMFEYGAPLVAVWAQGGGRDKDFASNATSGFRDLMGWILERPLLKRYKVMANLCGLTTLDARFAALRTQHEAVWRALPSTHPLTILRGWGSAARSRARTEAQAFVRGLAFDNGYARFEAARRTAPLGRTMELGSWLREARIAALRTYAQTTKLLRSVPFATDDRVGLGYADKAFSAERKTQSLLLRYRLGTLCLNTACECGATYHRGHEDECVELADVVALSPEDAGRRTSRVSALRKWEVDNCVPLKEQATMTTVDFLLAEGRVEDAGAIVLRMQARFDQRHGEGRKEEEGMAEKRKWEADDGDKDHDKRLYGPMPR